jgi:hypothetical protein
VPGVEPDRREAIDGNEGAPVAELTYEIPTMHHNTGRIGDRLRRLEPGLPR